MLVSCTADIRETAFVYAITAAGVTHAVTQACSMGDLLQCGCEATRNRAPPRPPSASSGDGVKWEWGGCGDDVEFGYEKSKQFMDAKRRRGKSDIRTLIDLHNNEAGRLVRCSSRMNAAVDSRINRPQHCFIKGLLYLLRISHFYLTCGMFHKHAKEKGIAPSHICIAQ